MLGFANKIQSKRKTRKFIGGMKTLDKELLKLIGGNKKYIAYVVVLSVVGLLATLR